MAKSMLETLNIYNCLNPTANEDLFNGNPATDVISLENYTEAIFIITINAGGTGTTTVTIESCDDTTPTTSTAVAFRYKETTSGNTVGATTAAAAAGVGTTAGTNNIFVASILASELNGTDKFVRMQTTELVDGAVDGDVLVVLTGPRYPQDISVDATS